MNLDPTIAHREGTFAGKDGLQLYWQAVTPTGMPVAEVVFVHGYSEHTGRYRELFEWLAREGLAVHALDYRGHGRAAGPRGDVDSFGLYLDDVESLLERVGGEAAGRPVLLVGHSLGGLILARLLEERRPHVAGVVFASPYMGLALVPPWLKVVLGKMVGWIKPGLQVGNGLSSSMLTRDLEWRRRIEEDPLYSGVTTPRWFRESNAAQDRALARAATIEAPALVLIPEKDPVADPATGRRFFESLGSPDKELIEYPDALHELFHELPETREQVFADVTGWLLRRAAPRVEAPTAL